MPSFDFDLRGDELAELAGDRGAGGVEQAEHALARGRALHRDHAEVAALA